MDATPLSPVFDALLGLNPWAKPHWERRLEAIGAGTWNVNYVNQGGNAPTRDLLGSFFADRTQATLDRLTSGGHPEWNAGVYEIVAPLFRDPDFASVHAGTPMKPMRSGALANTDAQVEGYSLGQFKADVIHLAQPGLQKLRRAAPLDLSGLAFTIGPVIGGSDLAEISAQEAQFGPFAEMNSNRFGRFDVAGAEFYDSVDFTTSGFSGDALFAGVTFHAGASIQAVVFGAEADFTGAVLDGWAAFAGSVFQRTVSFRDARFNDDVTFESAQFLASADFTGTSFRGEVSTADVDPAVTAMIRAAQR